MHDEQWHFRPPFSPTDTKPTLWTCSSGCISCSPTEEQENAAPFTRAKAKMTPLWCNFLMIFWIFGLYLQHLDNVMLPRLNSTRLWDRLYHTPLHTCHATILMPLCTATICPCIHECGLCGLWHVYVCVVVPAACIQAVWPLICPWWCMYGACSLCIQYVHMLQSYYYITSIL